MRFTKMHGAGNDYVYVNCFSETLPEPPERLAVKITDRRFGVGGDGLILIEPSEVADARMRMFNADGTRTEMCGNGIRCVAKYIFDHGICRDRSPRIETDVGILTAQIQARDDQASRVRVDMGIPITNPVEIPTTLSTHPVVDLTTRFGELTTQVTAISMGNPHCVIFVPQATDEVVLGLGPLIEADARFPNRTNVEFVECVSSTELRQRTWERGVGETLACGTGACAACVAGVLTGRTCRELRVRLLGGDLEVQWEEASGRVFLTGGATQVFHGVWPEKASRSN